MGELHEVLVPISFEVADLEAKQSGDAIEIEPGRFVQVSPTTVEAIALASRIASSGRLRFVHATPDLTHFGVYGGPEGAWFPMDAAGDIHRATKERSLRVLQVLAERHAGGLTVEYDVFPGSPTLVILDVAARHPPDAIVLAASGRSRLRRVVLGSTANKIIREAPCPVVVVPGPREHGKHAIPASL